MKKIFMVLAIVMGISVASIARANCCYNDAYKSLGFHADSSGTYGCSKKYCTTSSVTTPANAPGKGQCQCPYSFVNGSLMNGSSTVAWDGASSCPGCGHPVLSAHFCE